MENENNAKLPNICPDGYKKIEPRFWGKNYNKESLGPLIYLIHERNLGIIYIGKQTNSTRIADFLKCYLALRKLFKSAKNGLTIEAFEGNVETYETDGYGDGFNIISGLTNDLTQVLKLARLCKEKKVDFDKLSFSICVRHLPKEELESEEKRSIKELKPLLNSQLKNGRSSFNKYIMVLREVVQ